MGYNRTIFNQGAFNREEQGEAGFSAEGFERVHCVSSGSESVRLEVNGFESVAFKAVLFQSYAPTPQGVEAFGATVTLRTALLLTGEGQAQIGCAAEVGATIDFDLDADERAWGDAEAAFILGLSAEGLSAFSLSGRIGAVIGLGTEGCEIIGATAGVDNIEEVTLFADVSIPPGGKLIIDARYFTAYLNGINVIDKIRGDWLDELNRETLEIRVDAGNSNQLATNLLYEELYL